ncbi:MAG: efflux RND transporter permease subunit, partial [Calditrichaeota bacterium]|nr:efflux RND transporter permease subunit [Calditrichota bacterium]
VILALGGSLILSFTAIPALCATILPMRSKKDPGEMWLVKTLQSLYRPILEWCMSRGRLVLIGTLVLVAIAGITFTRLGAEFIPKLSEGSIVVNLIRLAGISLEQSTDQGAHVEKLLKEKFPDEVAEIWTRTGTPEVATDPMGVELADVFIAMKPREEWKQTNNQQQLVEMMDAELSDLPGMNMGFTQPIEMRFNEMISGIRTDVGIKVFGDDMEILKQKADQISKIVGEIQGVADLNQEQITGQPVLKLIVDRKSLSRYSLSSEVVLESIKMIGGSVVGEVREDQRRFELAVKFDTTFTRTPEALHKILLYGQAGEHIPLGQVARFEQTEGPSTITREWGKRRVVVQCNVRGRDIDSFIGEVRAKLEKEVLLETGYFIRYGGQFENLERARTRLMIVVPIALMMIFGLLYLSFKSIRDALLIFSGVPLAAVGGVFALVIRAMPFSISAGVGFIALSGIAVLNGLVLVSAIRNLVKQGNGIDVAIKLGGLQRLRPVIMTALVASLGFVPMAMSNGVGAEVQRPLATVVIGGIITSTILTLLVLPVLYKRWGTRYHSVEDS